MLPHDRGVHADTKSDPFSGNIFVLTGEEWKQFQTRLTPSFTFGKLKSMFPMIQTISDEFVDYMQRIVNKLILLYY